MMLKLHEIGQKNAIGVNSIKLPDFFEQKRGLRYNKNHVDGYALDESDIEQFDNDTVFYDVFFDINNRFLYTIGPPFLNLEENLLPIVCRINNDKKKYQLQIKDYFNNKIAIGRISLENISLYDENIVELDFNGRFQWSGRIKLNRFEKIPVILTTIQKDNSIRWIKDWIEFYSKNYGINKAIIYDNNSSNRNELETISDNKLLIVTWDFKYGPIRSHKNQFCQLGSLNHCRLKFGSNNRIMNFDIDELLFIREPEFHKIIKKNDLILFNAYRVPYIKPDTEDYSYADFLYRNREPQNGGRKYVYNPKKVIVNNIHDAVLKKQQGLFFSRIKFLYNRLYNIKNISRIRSFLLYLLSIILKLKIIPNDEAYFLHYTGITNNWKSIYWNRKEETVLSDKHIKFNILEIETSKSSKEQKINNGPFRFRYNTHRQSPSISPTSSR